MSDDHFHSGDSHMLYDRTGFGEPDPAPEDCCIECGKRMTARCGCCGYPLCGRHHETGGGFCTSFHSVGGVGTCVYDEAVYVGVWPREELVLVTDGEADVYHLPDAAGETAPACRPAEDSKAEATLALVQEADMDLCEHCADEARIRYREFKQEVADELEAASE